MPGIYIKLDWRHVETGKKKHSICRILYYPRHPQEGLGMHLSWIRGDYCRYWWVDENVTRGSQEPVFAFPLRSMIHYSLFQSMCGVYRIREKNEN